MRIGNARPIETEVQECETLDLDESVFTKPIRGFGGERTRANRGVSALGDQCDPIANGRRNGGDRVVGHHHMSDRRLAGPCAPTSTHQTVIEHSGALLTSIPRDHEHDGSGDGYRRI